MYFCIGILACMRWMESRRPADAVVALLMLAACPLVKVPGRIWALLAVPALIVGLVPRRGMRIVGAGVAATVLCFLLFARTSPVILGYQLHLDFAPDWEALANSFFLYDNWHLLWYGAVVAALLGRRQLLAPRIAPLTAVVACGIVFLMLVMLFTNAREWVSDQSTVNRATLHLAPLVVVWMLMVFRAWMESLPAPSPDVASVAEESAPPAASPPELPPEAPPSPEAPSEGPSPPYPPAAAPIST
jgi:hypothetical protein